MVAGARSRRAGAAAGRGASDRGAIDRAGRRKVVLIVGMHRSGTSLLANMLAAAGLPFGSDLLSQGVPDNPDGYGEHAEIVDIQERLLQSLGREWHSPAGGAALPANWMSWPETRLARRRLGQVVRRELASGPVWACKDPRTSRLLPLWLDLLEAASLEAVPVLCIRDPAEVAASLAVRNGMPGERAEAIWLAHQLDPIEALGGRSMPVVDYARLLAEPERVLAGLFGRIGIRPEKQRLRRAARMARPTLRHHVAGADASGTAAGLLYGKLLRVSARPGLRLPGRALPAREAVASRVTVVMRTRDRSLFLPRAIRSVLAQTMPDWHLVIVNDGGRQADVLAAIRPYRPALAGRLTVLHLRDHVGMEAASNRAIRERDDPFVVIHDDDDSWDARFLEVCLGRLAGAGEAGVVSGSTLAYERVAGGRIVDGERLRFHPDITAITLGEMARENMFPPIAFVFARSAWESVGGFRAHLPVLGDWDFNRRFLRRHAIAYVPEPLAFWHRRPAQDPYPNSDPAQYEAVAAGLRDEMLRAAGDQGLAVMGVLVPALERMIARAGGDAAPLPVAGRVPVRMVAAGEMVAGGTAAASGAPPASGSPAPVRLVPTGAFQVEARGAGLASTGGDPQLHYDLSGRELWPGSHRARIALGRPGDGGPVELFFGPDANHSEARKVVLWEERPGLYAGEFPTSGLVGALRLDPMDRPGGFAAGPLVVEPVRARQRPGRLPDFLCIGAQRSGTTWLHHQLRAHPSLYLPPAKELHFLDEIDGIEPARWMHHRLRFLAGAQAAVAAARPDEATAAWETFEWAARFAATRRVDVEWYASLFADAPDDRVAGEITPAYALLSERLVRQVARLMPDLKVVFMMRDPVERALSGAVHELTRAVGLTDLPSEQAIAAELAGARCAARSGYRRTIETWERCLPAGSLGCFFYDDIRRDPAGLMRSVFTFLGVDPDRAPATGLGLRLNANPVVPPGLGDGALAGLLARYRADLDWLGERFGDAVGAWGGAGSAQAPGRPVSASRRSRRPR